jgi:hypothetical protein
MIRRIPHYYFFIRILFLRVKRQTPIVRHPSPGKQCFSLFTAKFKEVLFSCEINGKKFTSSFQLCFRFQNFLRKVLYCAMLTPVNCPAT